MTNHNVGERGKGWSFGDGWSIAQEWRLHNGEGKVPDWFWDFTYRVIASTKAAQMEEVETSLVELENQRILVVGSSNAGKRKTEGYHQAVRDFKALLQSKRGDLTKK